MIRRKIKEREKKDGKQEERRNPPYPAHLDEVDPDTLKKITIIKDKGNAFFKSKKLQKALRKYQEAINVCPETCKLF